MSSDASFGQIVKERRAAIGLTQAELANRVGCAPITIRRIEGNNLRPSVQMAELLALALKIPETEQLGFVRLARQKKADTPIPKPTPSPGEIGMADLTGRAVKGFQLGELIGSGGFGVVYRATQPSVKRDVAIKIILPRFANQPTFIRRFETEAHLVARLEHPHIVPLYDYWREPDAAYLIMRLLRGGSLEELIKSGPIPLADFQRIMPQICTALATAHRHGVIHRDIKPANVMLDEDKNAYLTDFGIAKNLETPDEQQLTQGGAIVGSPAYISPEQILAEPIQAPSDIYCLGIMLFEILAGQQPFPGPTSVAYLQQHLNDPLPLLKDVLPGLPDTFDDVIQKATAKKPEERYQSTLDMLIDLELGWQTAVSPPTTITTKPTTPTLSTQEIATLENPYRGLRAFTEADSANFHGRNALVQELLGMMSDGSDLSRFVAVVGPSGSGKSSVVKAGLIPALRRGGLPDSDNWFMVDLTPGSHPWEEVEAALLRIAVNPPDSLLSQLRDGARGLQRAIRRILPDDGETELVMVIDQFEELFTLVQDEGVRSHFLEGLVTAVLDPKSRLRLIITLRADFTDRPLQYVDFGELMRQRTAFVLPLTPNELTNAITRPITQLGMEMEPALISTIIREVGDQPGILPLMQYALTELFEERQGRTLTLNDYQSTGGVLGALARRADDIYDSLDNSGQEATRQLFLRLITLGEGVEDTRRRVLISELQTLRVSETLRVLEHVIDEYGRFHLLTFDHDPVTRAATVEVAHEALLREWPRLRNWLSDSREDVRRQRLLADATRQWHNAGQDDSYLLRGSRLVEFESWFETTTIALTENEQTILNSSIAARNQRQSAEEARRQKELETAKQLAKEQTHRAEEQTQAAKSLRQRAIFLAGALVVAAILAIAAFGFARSSTNNANLAATREDEAIANFALASTNEADAVRNANLAATREVEAEVERDRADGERETAVSAQQQAQAEANIRATAEAVAIEEREIAQQQTNLAISRELSQSANALLETDPELSMLLAMQAINSTYTKQAEEALRDALQQSRVRITLTDENADLNRAIYTPDGTKLAIRGSDDTMQLWDVATGERLKSVVMVGQIYWQQFYRSGDKLEVVISGEDNTGLRLLSWNINGNEVVEVQTFDVQLPTFMEAILSPDGTLLAFGNVDNEAELWDTVTGERLFILSRFTDLAWSYSFNQDGSRLVVGGRNGEVELFDIPTLLTANTPQPIAAFKRLMGDFMTFTLLSPAGERLALQFDGTTTTSEIWDIADPKNPELIQTAAEGLTISTFNHDGSLVLGRGALDGDGTVSVWEVATGEALFTLAGHSTIATSVVFSPDEQTIATGSRDGTVRIWDAALWEGGELQTSYYEMGFFDMDISPDQTLLTFGSGWGAAAIFDRQTLELIHSLEGGGEGVYRTSFHPTGSRLATVGADNVIRIWDVATGEVLLSWVGHELGNSSGGFYPGVLDVSYSPDGSRLATASSDGTAKVWDAETGEELLLLAGHTVGLHSLAYSPNGSMIATSSDNTENTVKVWDAETGAEIYTLQVEDRAWALAFSPDSQLLAAGGGGGFANLWDLNSGTELYALPSQLGTIGTILFTPDGKQFITSGGGNTRLWDVETGAEIKTITKNNLWNMILTTDGRFLYGGWGGVIKVFTLNVDDTIALANERLTRDFSEAECKQYLHVDACPVN
ncbi:MAG: helix-turn-helix domain-containing protein [Chloroflexi bacterium]|nr:MAG: helix-turn-helix domain-containing protein [Chloroflexota bacterium]